jgi:hypothetical protein
MSQTSPELLDAAWAAIERHLDGVAALVPADIARTLGAHDDIDEMVPRLVQALAGRVPDIEVPGLTPWVSSSRVVPPISFGPSGVTINMGANSSLAAQCEGLASDLVRLFSTSPDFRQAVQGDTREWAAHQVSRRIALGVLAARAAMRDLSRLMPLRDPEGLRLGLLNGLRLAARWRFMTSGPGQPRTAVSIDYRPQGYRDLATVENHQWTLVEPRAGGTDLPDEAFRENGLVSVIPGGVVVRTGVPRGRVFVTLTMADSAPTDPTRTWSEIVEVSYTATVGGAAIVGMPRGATTLTPGDYRARVMARRRDEADDPDGVGGEEYDIVVWAGPSEPTRIWAAADRLGYRLRGELEPSPAVRPETAYRWIDRFMDDGATVTIASGIGVDELISAFGGDPRLPAVVREPWEIDQMLLVGVLGDGVVAIEQNGWQGNQAEVLRRASVHGRVASVYWNVNGVERFAAAEDSEILEEIEYWSELKSPRLLELTEDLDRDASVDGVARGLVVAERFTGVVLTEAFATELRDAGRGYDLLPQLPDHHPFVEYGDYSFGPLLNEKHALLAATEQELRDITWWTVGEIAKHYGAEDPEVAATLQSRSLSPAAVLRARQAEIFTYPPTGLPVAPWPALHSATNPDPVAAMVAVAREVMWPQPWQVPILESLRERLHQVAGQ